MDGIYLKGDLYENTSYSFDALVYRGHIFSIELFQR